MADSDINHEQLIQELNELRLENNTLKEEVGLLKNCEEKYRLLHLNASIGIGLFSTEGTIISFNILAAKHMNGLPEDFEGRSIFDIFPEKEAEIYLKRIRKAAKYDVPLAYEDLVSLPSGNKYLLSTFSRIVDLHNNLLGVQILAHDITYRKEVEDKLKNSEEKFKFLFEYAPDAYFLTDFKGIFLDGNMAAEKLIGQNKKELIGTSYLKLSILSLKQIQKAGKLLIRNSLGLPTGPDEFILKRKDGSEVPVEILTYPVKIKDQSMVLGLARDITERKRVEKELSESHRKYIETASLLNAVLDAIPDIIGIQSLNHEIVRYNKAGYSFLGKTHEEVVGRKCYNLIGRDEICTVCSTTDCLKTKNPAQHQQYFPEYNRWLDMRSYPIIDEKGKIVHVIEHLRDITDIKTIEQKLIESKEKAEESDRLKSAFLANVSHEIRTPMNGILGFAELLNNPMLTGEEVRDYIDIIRKSGIRMLNIINDLIDVSKIESGQLSIYLSECNINDQVRYLYNFFKPEAVKKGLDISYKNSLPDKDAVIITDKDKLLVILTNLISNAVKFTDKGFIEFGYTLTGNSCLEFHVKDTGIGINPDQREIIFERFRQGSESLDRNYEGAGLGLYISKKYVEMLGGNIRVENNSVNPKSSSGSAFKFTVPYKKGTGTNAESLNKRPEEEKTVQASNLKILIAEDDEPSLILLSRMIRSISREILIARTGLEVVDICRDNPDLDLILMDIKMAEMDGYEATRHIRHFNRKVVIIAQTAYAQTGDEEISKQAGCDDYISKPFTKNDLLSIIDRFFKSSR